jgi:hypothetical protein
MSGAGGLGALRRFSRAGATAATEWCDGCRGALPPQHEHRLLLGGSSAQRKLECVCVACGAAEAAGSPWKRVPRRCAPVRDLDAADIEWEALGVPIRLAFFVVTGADAGPVAFFPSPGGAIELPPSRDAWSRMRAKSAAVRRMEPDVEALLVHHAGGDRGAGGAMVSHQYVVSIDVCYHLVGLVRAHWRGLEGGPQVWTRIDALYADLRREASDA